MSLELAQPARKLPVLKLAVAGVAVLLLAVLALRGVDIRGLAQRAMDFIRSVGPWGFFGAMAILPAVGAPMSAFTIPAGEAFAPQMGMAAVIAISLTAIAINLAFAYWLSRYALRPVLGGLLKRYGYSVPKITPQNALGVLLVVRLTPGPPYALQCFVLGVAEAPFRLYMIVSWLSLVPLTIGAIVLGRGLFNGNFGIVLIGIGVLVVASVAFHWVRKKYFSRET